MSAMFNFSPEIITSKNPGGSSADDNEVYVELILDIFDDSIVIHSVHSAEGGRALHEDQELYSLVKKTLEKKSSSSVRSSLFGNTFSHIKQVSQELKRLASTRFDAAKSAAAHALKGLKLIG